MGRFCRIAEKTRFISKDFISYVRKVIENLLATWHDGTRDCKLAMLRTNKAIAFAGQIDKVEAYYMWVRKISLLAKTTKIAKN